MGAISTLVLVGFTALAFAFADYLRMRKETPETADKRTAIAQDLVRRTLLAEIAIGALALIAAGFLKFRGIDIPTATWHTMTTIALAGLVLIAGPGLYAYLSWKQRLFGRKRRLPDGTLSEHDARVMRSMEKLKNLLLVAAAGLAFLLWVVR